MTSPGDVRLSARKMVELDMPARDPWFNPVSLLTPSQPDPGVLPGQDPEEEA